MLFFKYPIYEMSLKLSHYLMLTIPFMKSTKLQQSFLYQGVKTWNFIPHNIFPIA